jgi:glutathione-regulated potassium-efflux system ancillary protein KefC/glutathione-regulated potassium-efflux system protein KefB
VLLLFIIGIELQPRRLWTLRKPIIGMGGAQVLITAFLITGVGWSLGLSPVPALIVGCALSMSSTAFALQTLAEKSQLTTQHGRAAFAILLFQDVAVIPLLAIIPTLGIDFVDEGSGRHLYGFIKAVIVIGVVIVGGRHLLRPFFRLIASLKSFELFTAAALLVVVGMALLMQSVGLSMELGSFLAGVLLADTEFRHELQANIEPFKGLLLGLFFIAVGMSVDVGLIIDSPLVIVGLACGLIALKGAVLYLLGRFNGLGNSSAGNLSIAISQGGEFAFVLFGVAVASAVLDATLANLLIVVVTLSMALTPLLFVVSERIGIYRDTVVEKPFDTIEDRENRVVIAGFGRFGQLVARVLVVRGIPFTALDRSFEQVDFVRRFGSKVFYGDAARLDLLRSANVGKAEVFVIAVDDVTASVRIAEMVKRHFPQVKIYARARNRQHVYQLRDIGVDYVVREIFHSSMVLTKHLLESLNIPETEAIEAVRLFQQHDEALLDRQQQIHHDEEKLIASAKQSLVELEDLFVQDKKANP